MKEQDVAKVYKRERGECPACGKVFSVKNNGALVAHSTYDLSLVDGETWVGWNTKQRYGFCKGAAQFSR